MAAVVRASQYDPSTNTTWATWQSTDGSNLVVHVSVFNHGSAAYTGTTPNIPPHSWGNVYEVGVAVATTFLVTDHGFPSIVLDNSGYWHIFFGTWFNNALQHAITTNPGDPTAWTQQASIGNTSTECPGYPNAVMVGSTMYLFYQNSLNGQTGPQLWMRASTSIVNGVVTFGSPVTIGDVSAGNEWFPSKYDVVGTDIWFLATRASLAATTAIRDNVYLLRYDTTNGSVKNVDASVTTAAGSLPVAAATLISSYAVVVPGAGNGGVIAALAFDSNGVPNVLYASGVNTNQYFNTYNMNALQFTGGAWSAPVALGSTTGASFNTVALLQDTDGGVTAYWPQINTGLAAAGTKNGGDIWTAHKPLNGSWGAAAAVQVAGQASTEFSLNPYGPFPLDGPSVVLNGLPEACK